MIDYSKAKQQAIELRKQGYSLRQIARRVGVHDSTVSRWITGVPFTGHNEESRREQLASFRDNDVYDRARELRREGWSYAMITDELGVPQSTLSHWLRDVEVEDTSIIEQRQHEGRQRTSETNQARSHARRATVRAAAVDQFDALFNDGITQRELSIAGLMLYWGEGAKTGNTSAFANSDSQVIRVYLHWLRECLNVEEEDLRAKIYCYPDTDVAHAEAYWSEVTHIPLDQFYKAQVDTRENKQVTRQGKLPYGTLHVKVTGQGSSDLHRTILAWIERLGTLLTA